MNRGSTTAAVVARRRFSGTMRTMADRLRIQYRPQTDELDWAGALGDYRDHRVALFIVSQTEMPMQTGMTVAFARPSPGGLASLEAVRSRKLRVDAPAVASEQQANLRPETAARATRLLEDVDSVKVDSERIVVLATGRCDFWQGFFEYRMETDTERLARIIDRTIDLAEGLE
jgi:hypothetical protein